jgi:hypothetical protein
MVAGIEIGCFLKFNCVNLVVNHDKSSYLVSISINGAITLNYFEGANSKIIISAVS